MLLRRNTLLEIKDTVLAAALTVFLLWATCAEASTGVATFRGDASTYNPNYAGWKTGGQGLATGGRYNPNGWEAALQLDLARRYGCGYGAGKTCHALVQASNGHAAILLINDNGPLVPGRVIDLNEKSMQYLSGGQYGRNSGVLRGVKVTILSDKNNPLGPIDAIERDRWANIAMSAPEGSLNTPSALGYPTNAGYPTQQNDPTQQNWPTQQNYPNPYGSGQPQITPQQQPYSQNVPSQPGTVQPGQYFTPSGPQNQISPSLYQPTTDSSAVAGLSSHAEPSASSRLYAMLQSGSSTTQGSGGRLVLGPASEEWNFATLGGTSTSEEFRHGQSSSPISDIIALAKLPQQSVEAIPAPIATSSYRTHAASSTAYAAKSTFAREGALPLGSQTFMSQDLGAMDAVASNQFRNIFLAALSVIKESLLRMLRAL